MLGDIQAKCECSGEQLASFKERYLIFLFRAEKFESQHSTSKAYWFSGESFLHYQNDLFWGVM
jgi:hypothetical protein